MVFHIGGKDGQSRFLCCEQEGAEVGAGCLTCRGAVMSRGGSSRSLRGGLSVITGSQGVRGGGWE